MVRPLDDLVGLCKSLFGITLYPYQEQIIRHIVNDSRRVTIRAATRAGKSYAVAIGIILYCMFNDGVRVGLIAPNADKAKIIMSYVSDLLTSNEQFLDFVVLERGSNRLERQKRELSKRKISFNNGTILEIRSVNLQMKGFGVTGFGYNLTVIDESAEIPDDCYHKIYRMLVEDKRAKIVEIGNPWFLNHFYRNHHSPDWVKIHISWKDCVEQGRMSQGDIDDQRKNQSDVEFKVLFDADFPDSEDDTLYPQQWIRKAQREVKVEEDDFRGILGVDVARFGRNKTVFTYTKRHGNLYIVTLVRDYPHLSVPEVAGHIINFCREHHVDLINVDAGGVGGGVYDALDEYYSAAEGKKPKINDICAGGKAINQFHLNFKTSIFMHVRELFKEHKIILTPAASTNDLLHQLPLFRFTFTSSGKCKIIDGQDISPDFADSFVYSCWDESASVIVDW